MFAVPSKDSVSLLMKLIVWGIPASAVSIGIICLIVGYFAFSPQNEGWRPFLITTGQTVLVGGVLAAMLKTFQYVGIFKQEIADVIYSSEFLEKLGELRLREIWAGVSMSLCKRRFPEVSKDVNENILKHYLPVEHKYYYKKYSMPLDIYWHNRDKNVVRLVSPLEGEIIPYIKDESIDYPFRFSGIDPDPNNDDEFRIEELKINERDMTGEAKKSYHNDSLGRRIVTESYNISLQGDDKYVVKRKYVRLFDARVDPVATFSLIVMCMHNRVVIRNNAHELSIYFQELGTVSEFLDFSQAVMEGNIIKHLYKEYEGVMFPRQGYLISFHMT